SLPQRRRRKGPAVRHRAQLGRYPRKPQRQAARAAIRRRQPLVAAEQPQARVRRGEQWAGRGDGANPPEFGKILPPGGHGMDPAKVAWCAAFVGASLRKGGQKDIPAARGGNMATAYLKWGRHVPSSEVKAGDVVVLGRGGTRARLGGLGHVAIATGPARHGRIPAIAGNVGHRVRTKTEPTSRAEVRRGTGPGPKKIVERGSTGDYPVFEAPRPKPMIHMGRMGRLLGMHTLPGDPLREAARQMLLSPGGRDPVARGK